MIHGDTTIGADDATRSTAYAGLFVDSLHVGVAVQINFVGKGDNLLRASDDAQAASLTPLGIHLNSAFHFCHIQYLFMDYTYLYNRKP